ncbi:MAG TPA: tRNA preQ1(34) S-adenosylmethionine ribosyltransferase-isomerase QueA [Acidimicrobiales bacterium]|nr:tRNA preQ1(34) S-adenosylmethionine ribosyltransferase-isomerase QueA [Acidimicrobiales bacterium]
MSTAQPVSDYDYDLPPAAVAQRPVEPRSAARLLVALDPLGAVEHRVVADLPDLVREGDVVVVNDTRVLPARLRLAKATGGAAEVLLLEPVDGGAGDDGDDGDAAGARTWEALVRPGRRLAPGTVLHAGDGTAVVEVGERLDGGRRRVRLLVGPGDLAAHGEVPLPPYIAEPLADPGRYQTVFARRPGSVAAPTAGLHLTDEILGRLRSSAGVEVHTVDLAVGLDTFRPVAADDLADHVMHSERYTVPEATMEACRRAGRVLAVGTTTVRALEAAARTGRLEGRTDLFIRPGFDFRVVDVLLTNFHLPRSSLLVLLAAFAGPDRWRPLYGTALAGGYRFLSFGDAMLIARAGPQPRPPRRSGAPSPPAP